MAGEARREVKRKLCLRNLNQNLLTQKKQRREALVGVSTCDTFKALDLCWDLQQYVQMLSCKHRRFIQEVCGLERINFTNLNDKTFLVWLTKWSSDRSADTDTTQRNIYIGVYSGLGLGQGNELIFHPAIKVIKYILMCHTAITLLATSVLFAIGCLQAARDLHNKLLHNAMRLPMSFFDTTPLGRILNRFSKDVDVIDNVLPMTMRFWMMMFFNTVGVLVTISYSTPIFLAVILPLGVFYYFIQKFYVATSRQLKRIESVTRSPIYTHFSETITGQSTIRAYGEEQR